jgi:3-oxoacyl-[acyl-carrier protein] reductase
VSAPRRQSHPVACPPAALSSAAYAAAKPGVVAFTRHLAAATLFLASDASSWITGVTLDVAGGKIML